MPLEPVVLFFVLGLAAGLARADLKLPTALYDTLSIYLLLAIGLKGGVELARHPLIDVLPQAAAAVAVALIIPLAAFAVLRRLGHFSRADAASIAAHYGSVSVVTFAVGTSYLTRLAVPYEGYMVAFLALLEFPALLLGVVLARRSAAEARNGQGALGNRELLREVFLGKSVFLLVGGLLIGAYAGADGIKSISPLFVDPFKGVLALFLLEMGLVAAGRLGDLRRVGIFLLSFALITPLVAGTLGAVTGWAIGLSIGGTTLLAILYASASYIAAPAAMRTAVPEANPALSIGASLGVTFPFNLLVGIPLYHWLAVSLHTLGAAS